MKHPSYKYMEELVAYHSTKRDEIRKRLEEFAKIAPSDYFYELVYCLLTPQSSAVNAAKTVETLRACGWPGRDVNVAEILLRKEHYIRFHNTKARRLAEVKQQFPEIARVLTGNLSSADLRVWLVQNVKGLGWKEASHFLRNIGHRNLAILDRHILKNLRKHNVLSALPTSLTEKRYLSIELRFARFSRHIGIAMDELDLLFWSLETGEILK